MTFAFATIRNAVLTAAAAITLAICATVSAQDDRPAASTWAPASARPTPTIMFMIPQTGPRQ